MMEERVSASRRKSTHEQLRSDHIELLTRLKSSEDNNKILQAEIIELKEQLINANSSSSTGFDNPVSNYREDWLIASQKSTDLAKELALVKRNAVDDLTRLREQHARAFEDYTTSMRRMQQSIKELQDEKRITLDSLDANLSCSTNGSYVDQVALLQSQLQTLQSQLDTLRCEATTTKEQLSAFQNENTSLHQMIEELRVQYLNQSQIVTTLTMERDQLTKSLQSSTINNENYLLKIRHLQEENNKFRSELHVLQLIAPTPPATIVVVMSTIGIQTTPEENKLPNNNTIVVPTVEPIQEKEQQLQASEEQEEMPLGFRFQEYLRLKRENKELKLRLTEKDELSSSRHASGKVMRGVLKSSGSSTMLPRLSSQKGSF